MNTFTVRVELDKPTPYWVRSRHFVSVKKSIFSTSAVKDSNWVHTSSSDFTIPYSEDVHHVVVQVMKKQQVVKEQTFSAKTLTNKEIKVIIL